MGPRQERHKRRLESKGKVAPPPPFSRQVHQPSQLIDCPLLQFSELFVAAYNKKPLSINEPDGIAAVWNLHLQDRPEYVFQAQVSPPVCTRLSGNTT